MYRFEKYGCLFKYNGIPLYVGNYCITKRKIVWWFPWNWIIVIVALPVAAIMAIKKSL